MLLFYSHRWCRPNWCEALRLEAAWGSAERTAAQAEGGRFGDPDDAARSKARALAQYARWFKREVPKSLSGAFGTHLAEITQDADLECHVMETPPTGTGAEEGADSSSPENEPKLIQNAAKRTQINAERSFSRE